MGEFIDHAYGTTQDRIQYKLMMEAARRENWMESWFGGMTALPAQLRRWSMQ